MSVQGAVEKVKMPAAHRNGRRSRAAHRNEAGAPEPEKLLPAGLAHIEEGDPLMQNEQNQQIVIRPVGAMEIGQAADFKQQLQAALAGGRQILLNLQDVTEMDVTAVQLLWALRQAAGERLQGQGDLPAEAAAALAEADLGRFLVA